MDHTKRISMKTIFLVIAILASPMPAYAYVDPSSSLLVLQGVLAALGALLVFVRNPLQTLKRWIAKLRGQKDA
jgi:hypothetical protein